MSIDPSTLQALRTVRRRTEFEQLTETFPEGTMREIQDYVGAARHLADDVQRLHATAQPATPEFVTLDEAHAMLETLNASTNPITGLPMDEWPGAPSADAADLVTCVLVYRILPVLSAHAAHLTDWLRTAGADTDDVAHVIAELHRRLMDRPRGSQGRVQWADWVSKSMRALGGLVNRARATHHASGSEIGGDQLRVALLGTGPQHWRQPLNHAVTALHALATKRLPDGRTFSWWPLRTGQTEAVHVGQVLDVVLAVLAEHASALAEHGSRVLSGADVPAFLEQMRERVTHMQVQAGGSENERAAATEFVQSGIHVLIGLLPYPGSPTLAELKAAR